MRKAITAHATFWLCCKTSPREKPFIQVMKMKMSLIWMKMNL